MVDDGRPPPFQENNVALLQLLENSYITLISIVLLYMYLCDSLRKDA